MAVEPNPAVADIARLVVITLRELKDPEGSTLPTIKTHIYKNYDTTSWTLRQIPDVLRRGILFGAIKKSTTGRYKLDNLLTLTARQHAIIVRRKAQHRINKQT